MNTSTRSFPDPRAVAMADPQAVTPLLPEEMVTDEMLRHLGRHDPVRDRGEISPGDQIILAMILPDLCGELLARRGAALTIVHLPGEDQLNLKAARKILRSEGPVARDILVTACQTLLNLSKDTIEQNSARDILRQLEVVA